MHTRPARKNRDTPGRRSSGGPGSELKKTLFFRIIRGNCSLSLVPRRKRCILILQICVSRSFSPVREKIKIYRPGGPRANEKSSRHQMNGSLKISTTSRSRSHSRSPRLEYLRQFFFLFLQFDNMSLCCSNEKATKGER